MIKTVYYIAPSNYSQCRVYATHLDNDQKIPTYRDKPDSWAEVGLMNYSGELVCFYGTPEHHRVIKDAEPLSAGAYFDFPHINIPNKD